MQRAFVADMGMLTYWGREVARPAMVKGQLNIQVQIFRMGLWGTSKPKVIMIVRKDGFAWLLFGPRRCVS